MANYRWGQTIQAITLQWKSRADSWCLDIPKLLPRETWCFALSNDNKSNILLLFRLRLAFQRRFTPNFNKIVDIKIKVPLYINVCNLLTLTWLFRHLTGLLQSFSYQCLLVLIQFVPNLFFFALKIRNSMKFHFWFCVFSEWQDPLVWFGLAHFSCSLAWSLF